jgi:hypothetical protein
MDGSQVSEKFDIIGYLQVLKLSVFHQNELGAVGRTS